jgi:hypothetical protein
LDLGSSLGAIRKYTLLLPKFGQKEKNKKKQEAASHKPQAASALKQTQLKSRIKTGKENYGNR